MPSSHSFRSRLTLSEIAEHLYTLVVRIHHIHMVFLVDEQPGRQLKVTESSSALAEAVEQLSLSIEDLHDARQPLGGIQMSLGVQAQSLRSEHLSLPFPKMPDAVLKSSRAVQNLHSKVHGVQYH